MRSELFHAAACRLFAVGSALVCGMISLRLYGRYLAPESYGFILVALQLIGYLPLLDGGFRTVLNRRMLASESVNERSALQAFGQVFYSWLLLIALAAALGLMVAYFLIARARNVDTPPPLLLFASMGLAGSLTFFASAQAALLIGIGAQTRLFVINGLSSWVIVAVLWASLWLSLEYWAFPLSMLAGGLGTLLLSFVAFARAGNRVTFLNWRTTASFAEVFRSLRSEALQSFRSQVAILFLMTSDVVLVGFLCKPQDVAVYGVFSRLIGIARGFLQSLPEASWPLIARTKGAHQAFADWMLHSNAWLHGFAAGGIAVLGTPFIRWYIGPEWTAPTLLAILITARFLIIGSSTTASYHFYGTGNFRVLARTCQRELIVAIVLALLLGHWFGMEGIAAGYLAATCAGTFIPLIVAYASARKLPAGIVFRQVWTRATGGVLLGAGLGAAIIKLAPFLTFSGR